MSSTCSIKETTSIVANLNNQPDTGQGDYACNSLLPNKNELITTEHLEYNSFNLIPSNPFDIQSNTECNNKLITFSTNGIPFSKTKHAPCNFFFKKNNQGVRIIS